MVRAVGVPAADEEAEAEAEATSVKPFMATLICTYDRYGAGAGSFSVVRSTLETVLGT